MVRLRISPQAALQGSVGSLVTGLEVSPRPTYDPSMASLVDVRAASIGQGIATPPLASFDGSAVGGVWSGQPAPFKSDKEFSQSARATRSSSDEGWGTPSPAPLTERGQRMLAFLLDANDPHVSRLGLRVRLPRARRSSRRLVDKHKALDPWCPEAPCTCPNRYAQKLPPFAGIPERAAPAPLPSISLRHARAQQLYLHRPLPLGIRRWLARCGNMAVKHTGITLHIGEERADAKNEEYVSIEAGPLDRPTAAEVLRDARGFWSAHERRQQLPDSKVSVAPGLGALWAHLQTPANVRAMVEMHRGTYQPQEPRRECARDPMLQCENLLRSRDHRKVRYRRMKRTVVLPLPLPLELRGCVGKDGQVYHRPGYLIYGRYLLKQLQKITTRSTTWLLLRRLEPPRKSLPHGGGNNPLPLYKSRCSCASVAALQTLPKLRARERRDIEKLTSASDDGSDSQGAPRKRALPRGPAPAAKRRSLRLSKLAT